MHSAFFLIDWGIQVLNFLNSNTLTIDEEKKISWVKKYQFALPNYKYLQELCKHALDIVHEQGYFQGMEQEFCKRTQSLTTLRHKNFQNKIKTILQNEGRKVPVGMHYLGSSEILESLFGKFKAIEGQHASSGLTSMILGIPALLGKLDESIIAKALQQISVADVENWITMNMGQTFLSKRRQALAKKSNQCKGKNKIKLTAYP